MRAALLFIIVLLAGCAAPMQLSTHPRVMVDAAFNADELPGILEGLASWHKAVPEIAFVVTLQDHATMLLPAPLDTIYIVRNEGSHDKCPMPQGEIGEAFAGVEYEADHHSTICLDATYVDAHGGLWKEITLHEVGHALGLAHAPPPSVMAIPYGSTTSEPQPADVANVRALWGFES